MPTNKVRADHDHLAQIAQVFDQAAANTQRMLARLKQPLDGLRGGAWIGDNATKFYREMSDQVEPALKRLHLALAEAAQVTHRISQVMYQAEVQAARVLQGDGDGLGVKSLDGDGTRPAGGSADAGGDSGVPVVGSSPAHPTQPPLRPLTGDLEEDVKILTAELEKYGVTVTYAGAFTPEEQVTMLSNILTSVSTLAERTNSELINLGVPESQASPYTAFGQVFGPTEFTLIPSKGTIKDPATNDNVYGYNSGLDEEGINQITLASYALLNETTNTPPGLNQDTDNVINEAGEVTITPVELVAHEIGHNLSSAYLFNYEPGEYHFLFTNKKIPDTWDIDVHVRSTNGAAEFTADYVVHWAFYPEATPQPISEFMTRVIQSEVGLSETAGPVQLSYNANEDKLEDYYQKEE